ncbi:MAG: hypothetical protein Q9166_002057 [cf. Caloplaca sp. 2 TL-2023]
MQERFKKMLQSVEMKDHPANLFCLAVLAVISSGQSPRTVNESGPSIQSAVALANTVECAGSYLVARWFFTSKRASKTLDLVVLRVVYACSKSRDLSIPDIIEVLHLSITVVKAIDYADRQTWTANNAGKLTKLVEKRLLDDSSVREQLLSLLLAAGRDCKNNDALRDTEAALFSIECFTLSVVTSATMRQTLLYLLSTNALTEPIRQFLDLKNEALPKGVAHEHTDICPFHLLERQMLLRQKICALFLKASFFSQLDSLSLDSSTAVALLDKSTSLNNRPTLCQPYGLKCHSHKTAPISLFEAGSTPCAMASSEQWRAHIQNDLAQNAKHQHQRIIRTMGDVCRDLERRCDEVEGPLRNEQAKSAQLHNQLDESKLRITELESHSHEQSLVLDGIEQEKCELAAHLRGVENERADLCSQVEKSREELSKTTQDAQDADRNAMKEKRELELAHMAAIAEKDEDLELQYRKELASRARIKELEADVADLQAKASVNEEQIARLETTITEQQTALSEANALLNAKQQIVDLQQQTSNRLEADKHDLESEVKGLSNDCQALRTEAEEGAAAFKDLSAKLDRIRCKYEADLAAQSHKFNQLRQSSDDKHRELQTLLEEQSEKAIDAAELQKSRVMQLQKEVSDGQHKYGTSTVSNISTTQLAESRVSLEERENELEEAQGLNEQVIAFWSKQRRRNPTAEQRVDTPRGSKDDSHGHSPYHKGPTMRFPRASPDHKRSTTTRHVESTVQARNRPRPFIGTPKSATSNKARPMRRPLRDLDLALNNISPTRNTSPKPAPTRLPEQYGRDENINSEMAEASFCDSDFFASTDQQLIADNHGGASRLGTDDTTAEF